MSRSAYPWPWFEPSAPTFDADKLTRQPNDCLSCGLPMIDIGETQIIYNCENLDCDHYRGGRFLDPLTGKGGYDPYLATVQARALEAA